jgi:hypothetical protein
MPRDEEPRRRPRRQRRSQPGTPWLLIAVFLAAGVVVILGTGLAVFILSRDGGRGMLGGATFLINPNLTDANIGKLSSGMTPAQVEAILGQGRPCDAEEIRSVCRASFDAHHTTEGDTVVQDGEKGSGVQSWRRWQNGGLHLFAGFRKDPVSVDRMVFYRWLHQLPGGAFGRGEEFLPLDPTQGNGGPGGSKGKIRKR